MGAFGDIGTRGLLFSARQPACRNRPRGIGGAWPSRHDGVAGEKSPNRLNENGVGAGDGSQAP